MGIEKWDESTTLPTYLRDPYRVYISTNSHDSIVEDLHIGPWTRTIQRFIKADWFLGIFLEL